ncbi:MAG: hypothetical protein ABJA67_01305 [Chthonomonadales bacterium]
MAVQEDNSLYARKPSAYGRIIREKGTRKLIYVALALAAAWYAYDSVHTNSMNSVKWPNITASRTGLAVLGLQNKDRMNFSHKYEARESNHSWQLRYKDEQDESADSGQKSSAEQTPEERDRGSSNPGATHSVNSGAVVPMDEIFKNCPAVLDDKSFSGASVDEHYDSFRQKKYYSVNLDLTDEGKSRYWQFSRVHAGEKLVFLINSETITCAIMENLYVGTLTINPIWVKADADQLADYLNKKK